MTGRPANAFRLVLAAFLGLLLANAALAQEAIVSARIVGVIDLK
jgi:hypothetical protein